MTMNVSASRRDRRLVREEDIQRTEHGVRAFATLIAGDVGGMVLETAPDGPPRRSSRRRRSSTCSSRRATSGASWIGRSHYRGRWREMVERSAMTLKLMTYAPTGALVAAPTAGLPEQVGGERNWDYRFTWIRDASFSVYALLGLGFTDEAQAFLQVAQRPGAGRRRASPRRCRSCTASTARRIWRRRPSTTSRATAAPARCASATAPPASCSSTSTARRWTRSTSPTPTVCGMSHDALVQHRARSWTGCATTGTQPDDGIWETRGGRQDFVYGRLMSWVAFDRAIRLAQDRGRPADLGRWTDARDAIYQQIMERGFHPKREAFVQHYDTDVLDASLLYMPLVGFIAPTDPMWQSTLRAMDEELVSDSLVYRYDPAASPDGLRGSEGTFTICSFWYVDALARSGRLDDARLTFEKMLTYSNHLGLYSEEIAPTGEQIGNFPQAFSHLSLISAAMNLDYQLDHGAGFVEPVLKHGAAVS